MELSAGIDRKLKYLGKNTIIFAISSFGTKFLSFLLVPLYTNVLSTAEYGAADLISAISTLLIYVLTINVEEGILRYVIDNRDEHTNILSYGIRILLRGTLLCSIGLAMVYLLNIFAWPLYYYTFILLYFTFTALYQIMTSYLRGLEKVTHVAIAGIIAAISMIVSNILCLLIFKIGIVGYLLSHVIGVFCGSLYCIAISKEPLSAYYRNWCNSKLSNQIKNYCMPLIFNNLALWINAFLDRFFVTALCGISENGIYSVASKIPTILATCYLVFSQAWNLSTIKEFDSEDKDGFFTKTYNVYNGSTCVACSILILLNFTLAKYLYAKEFLAAWRYSSVLLIFVMFNSLTIFLSSIFNAVKDTKIIARSTVFSAGVNVAFNIMLIPMFGPLGAAVATVISYVAMWLIRIFASKKYIKLGINVCRDCLTYVILVIQVIFDHIDGHFYFGQLFCLFTIILLQKNNFRMIYGIGNRLFRIKSK